MKWHVKCFFLYSKANKELWKEASIPTCCAQLELQSEMLFSYSKANKELYVKRPLRLPYTYILYSAQLEAQSEMFML